MLDENNEEFDSYEYYKQYGEDPADIIEQLQKDKEQLKKIAHDLNSNYYEYLTGSCLVGCSCPDCKEAMNKKEAFKNKINNI